MRLKSIHATVLVLGLSSTLAVAAPVGTAFTYQGRLTDGGNPAQGIYEFRFAVYDSPGAGVPAGPVITNVVGVTNGLCTTSLDFGTGVFDGSARWLGLGVRANGSASDFTPLEPRQLVAARGMTLRLLTRPMGRP